jgi:hypothetical protein
LESREKIAASQCKDLFSIAVEKAGPTDGGPKVRVVCSLAQSVKAVNHKQHFFLDDKKHNSVKTRQNQDIEKNPFGSEEEFFHSC